MGAERKRKLRRPMIAHISIRWLNRSLYSPFFFFLTKSLNSFLYIFDSIANHFEFEKQKIEVHFCLVENFHLSGNVIIFHFLFSRNSLLKKPKKCWSCLWKRADQKSQTEMMFTYIPWLINKYLKLRII